MIKTKIDPELEADARYSLSSADIIERYDWQKIFGNDHPVEIELGAGDGGFIIEFAQKHPEVNFVAVERLTGRVRKIIKNAARQGLSNVRAVQLESEYVVRFLCPPESVRAIHVMFPDPWPKKKHHKRRLIQSNFIEVSMQALIGSGELRFTTDHEEYFSWAKELFEEASCCQGMPLWDYSEDPLTDFQKSFIEEGRPFYRGRWGKKR